MTFNAICFKMVNKCFITKCKSGYDNQVEKVTMFSVPKNENMLKLWRRVIPRKDRLLSVKDHVCIKHFQDEDIIKVWTDGVNTIPLRNYRLKGDAYPSVFPDCPKYLIVKPIKKRRTLVKHEVPIKKKKPLEPVDTDNNAESSTFENERDVNVSGIDVHVCASSTIVQHIEAEFSFTSIWSGKIMLPNEFWSHSKILKNGNQFTSFTKYTITYDGIPVVEKQVVIDSSLSIKYVVMQEMYNNDIFLPKFVTSVQEFENMLMIFNDLNLCKGGPSLDNYPESIFLSIGKIKYPDKKVNVWRHKKCSIFLSTPGTQKCCFCKTLSKILCIQNRRQKTKRLETIDIRRTVINQKKKLLRLNTKVKSLSKHLTEVKKKLSEFEVSNLEKKID